MLRADPVLLQTIPVKDDTVIIQVDDNVKLEFNKSAVSSINNTAKAEKPSRAVEETTSDQESEESED